MCVDCCREKALETRETVVESYRSQIPGAVMTVVPYVARDCALKKEYPLLNMYAVIACARRDANVPTASGERNRWVVDAMCANETRRVPNLLRVSIPRRHDAAVPRDGLWLWCLAFFFK